VDLPYSKYGFPGFDTVLIKFEVLIILFISGSREKYEDGASTWLHKV